MESLADVSDIVRYEEEFYDSPRGSNLFTCSWLPKKDIKALVFLCHGTGMRLALAGYAVFGVDYIGHGKSEGMRCYISKFSDVVDDCTAFFKSIRDRPAYTNKASFLYGESMGGAVALLIHRMEPQDWNGAILVAPMCKISEKLKPPEILTFLLTKLSRIIPTWKIVPTKDIIETGFKDPMKRQEIRSNPYSYQEKPRLKTATELLNTSLDLERRLDEITLPFLVLHGAADVVTDPEISKTLFHMARSKDKTLKVYPGMWHGLTFGEPEDSVNQVFQDITAWLDERSISKSPNELARSAISGLDLDSVTKTTTDLSAAETEPKFSGSLPSAQSLELDAI